MYIPIPTKSKERLISVSAFKCFVLPNNRNTIPNISIKLEVNNEFTCFSVFHFKFGIFPFRGAKHSYRTI